MKITETILYAGINDHQIDLFEGQFEVPLGMAYNSYVILDEKIAVMDTADVHFTEEWLGNVKQILGGRTPDYLVLHHMEPDHSASILRFLKEYPETTVVGNAKTFTFFGQFYGSYPEMKRLVVKNGDTLPLGSHTLNFVLAPMVHWPEVMMSYESSEGVLFSADAFGKFGANDVEDPEGWSCEARRYYFGIVGKYGVQVQNVLKKVKTLDIRRICPLHGPVLDEDIAYYLNIYDTWSSYQPETEGVFVAYTSVYGHTKEAALLLAELLREKGCPKVAVADLAREDEYESVEDAFRYGTLVLATTTYNGEVFPVMHQFIHHLTSRGYQNRKIAFVENGSWAPTAAKCMKALLEGGKNLTFAENTVTIRSAMTDAERAAIAALADELTEIYRA